MKKQIKRISKGEKIFTILMGIVIGVIIVVHVLKDTNAI